MTLQQITAIQKSLHYAIDQQNAILNKKYGTNCNAVKDGILDLETYSKLSSLLSPQEIPVPLKIAFVLKEPPVENAILFEDVWNPDDSVQAGQAIRNMGKYATLRYLAYVAHQLLGKVLPPLVARPNYPRHLIGHPEIQSFCSTAQLNIRKQCGDSTTTSNALYNYVQDWGNIVMRQIKEYDSDIVFWCGTFDACNNNGLFSNISLSKISKNAIPGKKCDIFTAMFNGRKRLFVSCYHTGYSIPGGCYAYWDAIVQVVKNFVNQEFGYKI